MEKKTRERPWNPPILATILPNESELCLLSLVVTAVAVAVAVAVDLRELFEVTRSGIELRGTGRE